MEVIPLFLEGCRREGRERIPWAASFSFVEVKWRCGPARAGLRFARGPDRSQRGWARSVRGPDFVDQKLGQQRAEDSRYGGEDYRQSFVGQEFSDGRSAECL
jgi:hypothetical protein